MPPSSPPDGETERSPTGLYFLFEGGNRPRRSKVLAALETLAFVSVSHDPASSIAEDAESVGPGAGGGGNWLELLNSGMTFDLLGMAPGPGVAVPHVAHRLACDADCGFEEFEAMALVPGPHLADGANNLPVVRAMLELGCGLASALEDVGILCWSPARTAIATGMFCSSVDTWLSGGPLPALGLAAFAIDEEGKLTSEGLHFFVEQELQFSEELSQDRIAATRLGVRLAHEIVGSGPVKTTREFVTEAGERVLLQPDIDTGRIEVLRM